MRVSLAACVLLVGCRLDLWSDSPPDAPPLPSPVDAAPCDDASDLCGGWQQVTVGLVDATLVETRPLHTGRAARIRVAHRQCPGDYPGRWSVGFTLENEYLAISTVVWRPGPDCVAPELASRVVTVRFPYAGTWKVPTENGVVSMAVAAPPIGVCGSAPPSACQRDCDCPSGEVCLSGAGVQRCAAPCEYSRDCHGDGRCGDEDGLTDVCRRALAECNANVACPDGFTCTTGTCQPAFVLNGSTRHACECDADCDAPLRCVAHYIGGTDPWRKQCDVICPTPFDGWCEGPHTCSSGSIDYGDGVCGWIGD